MKKQMIFLAILIVILSVSMGIDESYAGQATAYASILIIIPSKDTQAAETRLAQEQTSEDTTPAGPQLAYAQSEENN